MFVIRHLKHRIKALYYKLARNALSRQPLIVDMRCCDNVCSPQLVMPVRNNYNSNHVQFLFSIPSSRIMDYHHFRIWIETLMRWQNEQQAIGVLESPSFQYLQHFYSDYRPKTVADFLHLNSNQAALSSSQSQYFSSLPENEIKPWSPMTLQENYLRRINTMKHEFSKHKLGRYANSDGFKTFGPASEKLILNEYHRLTTTFDSLRIHGFIEKYGYPTANLFVSGNNYMITPKHGWHRTAAMIALGYKEIPFLLRLDKDSIVRREEVKNWHHVKSGLYTEEQALSIFDKRFVPLVDSLDS